MIFLSGMIATDSKTGKKIPGGFADQVRQVMENIKTILIEAGSSWDQALKVGVFVDSMNEFSTFNEIYRSYFSTDELPARTTVRIAGFRDNTHIEMDVTAAVEKES